MHEYHIVEGIVKQITEKAAASHALKVTKVTLAMGPQCGLEEGSVRLYFETISEGTVAEGAELVFTPKSGKEFYIENIEVES